MSSYLNVITITITKEKKIGKKNTHTHKQARKKKNNAQEPILTATAIDRNLYNAITYSNCRELRLPVQDAEELYKQEKNTGRGKGAVREGGTGVAGWVAGGWGLRETLDKMRKTRRVRERERD